MVANVTPSDGGGHTTYRLAAEAARRGHEVWFMGAGSFTYDSDGTLRARVRAAPPGRSRSSEAYLAALQGRESVRRWITVDDLDILLLRANPSVQRAWAQAGGVGFARLAVRRGVIVLNDPEGLTRASGTLYLQSFPEEIRPRTLVTRSRGRIRRFAAEQGTIVLKPLQGSGGRGVFLVRPQDASNLDEIVRAVRRDGYVVAQEYLPRAAKGDTRLFLMNGSPLRHRGRYAAFRRARTGGDLRSNIHAGGRLRPAIVNDAMLRLAEIARPRLVEDGMFLVGLDIAGDRLLEINVFSPGGLGSARLFEKVDFAEAVVDALERKVQYMAYYRRRHGNVEIATL